MSLIVSNAWIIVTVQGIFQFKNILVQKFIRVLNIEHGLWKLFVTGNVFCLGSSLYISEKKQKKQKTSPLNCLAFF